MFAQKFTKLGIVTSAMQPDVVAAIFVTHNLNFLCRTFCILFLDSSSQASPIRRGDSPLLDVIDTLTKSSSSEKSGYCCCFNYSGTRYNEPRCNEPRCNEPRYNERRCNEPRCNEPRFNKPRFNEDPVITNNI